MIVVRLLLQIAIAVMALLVLCGTLMRPLTSNDWVFLLNALLFFTALFVAAFSIGEDKEKRWANILGYPVNPKIVGTILVALGAIIALAPWSVLPSQSPGDSQMYVRGGLIFEALLRVPALLVPAGLATAWYGVKLLRARRPDKHLHQAHPKT